MGGSGNKLIVLLTKLGMIIWVCEETLKRLEEWNEIYCRWSRVRLPNNRRRINLSLTGGELFVFGGGGAKVAMMTIE